MLLFICVLFVFSELQREILQTENQLAKLNIEIADLKEVKVERSLFFYSFVCIVQGNEMRNITKSSLYLKSP